MRHAAGRTDAIARLAAWTLAARRCSAAAGAEERLAAAITPQAAQQLGRDGWAVVDGIFGRETCAALLLELQDLRARGLMVLNNTHMVRGGERQLLEKAAIYEADLLRPEVFAAAPSFARLQAGSSLRTMLSLFLPQLRLDSQATKLQANAGGGGCFPVHFDSDEALDSRRVTALVYLNSNWRPTDGGQLRLYPSLTEGEAVDVEPLADRLLLFSSCRMLHRVLPSSAERFCFTIWLSDTRGKRPAPTPLPQVLQAAAASAGGGQRSPEQLRAALREPELRKCLTKLAHAREWLRSLAESHPDTPARAAAIADLEAELAFLRTRFNAAFPGVILADWVAADRTQPPVWF